MDSKTTLNMLVDTARVKCIELNFRYVESSSTTTVEQCIPKDGFSQESLDIISWIPLASLITFKFSYSIGYGQ